MFVVHPDHSYSYAYGPPGILGLLHNYYALGCAVFASIGGLLFGYDQGVIANVLVMRDFVERWPVGSWEKGLTSASDSVATTVWLDILTELQYSDLHFAPMFLGCDVSSRDARAWFAGGCLDCRNLRGPLFAKTVYNIRMWYVSYLT